MRGRLGAASFERGHQKGMLHREASPGTHSVTMPSRFVLHLLRSREKQYNTGNGTDGVAAAKRTSTKTSFYFLKLEPCGSSMPRVMPRMVQSARMLCIALLCAMQHVCRAFIVPASLPIRSINAGDMERTGSLDTLTMYAPSHHLSRRHVVTLAAGLGIFGNVLQNPKSAVAFQDYDSWKADRDRRESMTPGEFTVEFENGPLGLDLQEVSTSSTVPKTPVLRMETIGRKGATGAQAGKHSCT
eukprot:103040-Rhodomonas_salina.1